MYNIQMHEMGRCLVGQATVTIDVVILVVDHWGRGRGG